MDPRSLETDGDGGGEDAAEDLEVVSPWFSGRRPAQSQSLDTFRSRWHCRRRSRGPKSAPNANVSRSAALSFSGGFPSSKKRIFASQSECQKLYSQRPRRRGCVVSSLPDVRMWGRPAR